MWKRLLMRVRGENRRRHARSPKSGSRRASVTEHYRVAEPEWSTLRDIPFNRGTGPFQKLSERILIPF